MHMQRTQVHRVRTADAHIADVHGIGEIVVAAAEVVVAYLPAVYGSDGLTQRRRRCWLGGAGF